MNPLAEPVLRLVIGLKLIVILPPGCHWLLLSPRSYSSGKLVSEHHFVEKYLQSKARNVVFVVVVRGYLVSWWVNETVCFFQATISCMELWLVADFEWQHNNLSLTQ